MGHIGSYLKKQIEEIRADPALRAYGTCLAATHLVTWASWISPLNSPSVLERLGSRSVAYCWPFFERCHALRPMPRQVVMGALIIYAVLSIGAGILFLRPRRTGTAYWLLALSTLCKFAIFAQDYRMMGNYHYMAFISIAVFLCAPSKRIALMVMTVAYYLAAGILKFNYEWLSAASLAPRTSLSEVVPIGVLQFGCAFVVILEMVLVWGLLASKRVIFGTVFFLFLVFHVFSWHIVGFLYPCTMFALLGIFPLSRVYPDPSKRTPEGSLLADFFECRAPKSVYGIVGVFALLQFWPHLFRGDSAITTEGRMLSLNMFDARVDCESQLVVSRPGSVEVSFPSFLQLGTLLHCDPLIYLGQARSACRDLATRGSDFTIDLYLNAKRSTETEYRPLLAIADICKKDPTYSMALGNDWILK